MKNDVIDRIINYLETNEDIARECLEQLDGYNGYLGDDRYYPMEELDELYNGQDPLEVLYRAYYGYDEDSYTTDSSGNKDYREFNPNRKYFKFNGYGNLVSTDYPDYSGLLDHYAVETMLENRTYIDAIDEDDELKALFDELEKEAEDNE